MKAFGLELRKADSIRNLYRDVDAVLEKHNIQKGAITAELQVQTVAHSLQKMMKSDRWFCVSTVRDCAKLCGIVISSERMNVYSCAHCIHWSEMLPDYRQTLCAMVLDDFREILN